LGSIPNRTGAILDSCCNTGFGDEDFTSTLTSSLSFTSSSSSSSLSTFALSFFAVDDSDKRILRVDGFGASLALASSASFFSKAG
jgi:hypothetical protein